MNKKILSLTVLTGITLLVGCTECVNRNNDTLGQINSDINDWPGDPLIWLIGSSLIDGTDVNYEVTGDINTCSIQNADTGIIGSSGVVSISGGTSQYVYVYNCAAGSHSITVSFSYNGMSVAENFTIVQSLSSKGY
ncbi:hypothetical protein FRA_34c07330 [Francisella sp. W12-1067]|nr:hypothetical protein FRA_34c07330 [Francisella sp. W12-1067]